MVWFKTKSEINQSTSLGSIETKEAQVPKQTCLRQGLALLLDTRQPRTAHCPKLGAVGTTGPSADHGGRLLAVDFDDFYRQYSFRFHAFRTILLWFSLTLTSSTSFGDYLNPGATYTKMSQNGVNPGRPAYPCNTSSWNFVEHVLRPRSSHSNVV